PSSRKISSSRRVASPSLPKRSRRYVVSSGMRDSGDAMKRLKEHAPFCAQRGHLLFALGRQVVVAALAPALGFFPLPLHPTAFFHSIEQRIERGQIELEDAARLLRDTLGDFVTVQGLLVEQRQDGQLAAAAFDFALDFRHRDSYRLLSYISVGRLSREKLRVRA